MTGAPPTPKSVVERQKKDALQRKKEIVAALKDKEWATAIAVICHNLGYELSREDSYDPEDSWKYRDYEGADVTYEVLSTAKHFSQK